MARAIQVTAEPRLDRWVPACGGTETPTKYRSGRTLLYVYNAHTGNHAYLDCEEALAAIGMDPVATMESIKEMVYRNV